MFACKVLTQKRFKRCSPSTAGRGGVGWHLVPQEAIVDEDTVQSVPQDLVHKGGCNSAVNAP